MTNNSENSVLDAIGLEIGYKAKKTNQIIAKDINFSLFKGELVGIVGSNGIGKSTLIRTLSNVQPKIKGSLLLNSKPVNDYLPLELAQELSLVLTEQIVSKNLTVYELIALGRQPYTNWIGKLTNTDINEVENAIKILNLENIQLKRCYELSDGQLQQVMIARAIAQDTDLIILDEPTTHLDLYNKAYILKLLKNLVLSTNKTILFSSHEIDLSIQICDKIIIMTDKKVYFDSPCNLISRGVFNELFPKDLISFDDNTGTFKVLK